MPSLTLDISKKIFNEAFFPFLDDQTPEQIFFGGAASGKSVFLAQRCTIDILKNERNYLVLRNTQRSNRDSTFNQVRQVINDFHLRKYFDIGLSDMTLTCLLNEQQILFRGLDDAEKMKSILPAKGIITDIIFEEATEFSEKDYDDMSIRVRGESPHVKRKILSLNPVYITHWIYNRFMKNFIGPIMRTAERVIMHSTHKDNKFLTQQDHDALENHPSEYHRAVYGRGEWGVLGDLIFTKVEVEDLREIEKTFDKFRYGLDFGFSSDPAAFVRCAMRGDDVYIFDCRKQRGLTNSVLATMLKPLVGQGIVHCDCAEPKSIAELQLDKYAPINAVACSKGRDSVVHGVQWLQNKTIHVDIRRCQDVKNELGIYQWKKNKDGQSIPEPVEGNEHTIDAIRYAFEEDITGRGSVQLF